MALSVAFQHALTRVPSEPSTSVEGEQENDNKNWGRGTRGQKVKQSFRAVRREKGRITGRLTKTKGMEKRLMQNLKLVISFQNPAELSYMGYTWVIKWKLWYGAGDLSLGIIWRSGDLQNNTDYCHCPRLPARTLWADKNIFYSTHVWNSQNYRHENFKRKKSDVMLHAYNFRAEEQRQAA